MAVEVGRGGRLAKLEYGAPSWGEAGTRSRGVPRGRAGRRKQRCWSHCSGAGHTAHTEAEHGLGAESVEVLAVVTEVTVEVAVAWPVKRGALRGSGQSSCLLEEGS